MTLKTKVAIVAVLVLGGIAFAQTWRLRSARAAAWNEHLDRQASDMKQAGLVAAAQGTQRQLVDILDRMKAKLKAAQEAGARVAVASRFEGKADTIHVPAIDRPGPPRTAQAPAGTVDVSVAAGCDVDPWVRLEEAVLVDDAGRVYLKRDVAVQLQAGTWYSGWKPVKPAALSGPEVLVDPELSKAIAAYRMPKDLRLPWSLQLHALAVGPAPLGVAVGGTYFPKGSRVGPTVLYQVVGRDVEAYNYQTESYATRTVTDRAFLAGATWRFGGR